MQHATPLSSVPLLLLRKRTFVQSHSLKHGGRVISPAPPSQELRFQAVLKLLQGNPASVVSAQYGIARSSLYKFRKRTPVAIQQAMKDEPRGPKHPHNRVGEEQEQKVLSLCELRPTFSSYKIASHLGANAPSPRTIQRIRKKNHLVKYLKRNPPINPAQRLTARADRELRDLLHEKIYLGPDRLTWDLWNSKGIYVSPSTFKRRKRKWLEATANFFRSNPSRVEKL